MQEIRKLRIKCILINMFAVTIILVMAFVMIESTLQNRMMFDFAKFMNSTLISVDKQDSVETLGDGNIKIPYFVLEVDGKGVVTWIKGEYFTFTNSEQMKYLADQAVASEKDAGILSAFPMRYLRMPFHDGYQIIFIDTTIENSIKNHATRIMLCIGTGVWVVFGMFSVLLSKVMVKPVAQTMKRQKQFIGDASHELKTPLTVISANTELLMTDESCLSEDEQRRLRYIKHETDNMKELVTELLDHARQDISTKKVKKSKQDISQLITECLLEFEILFYQDQKTLTWQVDDNICANANADQVRQLTRILLDNALKYSTDRGDTVVTLKTNGYHKFVLSVGSAGIEIPKNQRKEIFQRFYRMDKTRNDKKGYGIGLSIAQQIVNQNRGKIYVEYENQKNWFLVKMNRMR